MEKYGTFLTGIMTSQVYVNNKHSASV